MFKLLYCILLENPFDEVPFLKYSKIWRTTMRFKLRHRMDMTARIFFSWHYQKFYLTLDRERRRLYVDILDWWRSYVPCLSLAALTSPMYSYFACEFVEGRETSSPSARKSLYCVALAEHWVIGLMKLLTRLLPHRVLQTEDLPGYDAHIRVGVHGCISHPLP